MPFPATIPAAIADLVVGFLLPLSIGACGGDAQGAKATALRLLTEHHPRTGNELLLAGSAIGHRLRGLAMLARSAEPDLPPDAVDQAMKWACSLSRTSQQAQRRLDELLRTAPRCDDAVVAAQDGAPPDTAPEPQPTLAAPEAVAVAPAPTEALTAPAPTEALTAPAQSAATPAAPHAVEEPVVGMPGSVITQLQAKLRNAENLVALMKARWKGAPPPHSKAAQDIKAQQRVVDTTRLALARARRHDAEALV